MIIHDLQSAESAWDSIEGGNLPQLAFDNWPIFQYRLLTEGDPVIFTLSELDGITRLSRIVSEQVQKGTNSKSIGLANYTRFEFRSGSSEVLVHLADLVNAVASALKSANSLTPSGALALLAVTATLSLPLSLLVLYKLKQQSDEIKHRELKIFMKIVDKAQTEPTLQSIVDGLSGGISNLVKRSRQTTDVEINGQVLDPRLKRLAGEVSVAVNSDTTDKLSGHFLVKDIHSTGRDSYRIHLLQIGDNRGQFAPNQYKRIQIGLNRFIHPKVLIERLKALEAAKRTFQATISVSAQGIGLNITEIEGRRVSILLRDERRKAKHGFRFREPDGLSSDES